MFAEKQKVMTDLLREIGQMKDMLKSEPAAYFARIQKKNGKGFTYFYTRREYDNYLEFRGAA